MFLLMMSLTLSSVSAVTIYRQSLSAHSLAVCNDGQAAALYYEGPSQATEYLIGLQGGGECHTVQGCQTRCENTTSPDYRLCGPFTRPQHNIQGMYSDNATINPTFHNYHKTFIPYCSSDFHSGNRTASSETGGYPFRGKEIFIAAIEYLKIHTDVAKATTVVFNGGSAGGFGVLANCDFLRTLLPDVQDVRCVVDAAGFIPLNLAEGCPGDDVGTFFDYIPAFWNGITNELCSEQTNLQARKNCYDLEYVLKFIRSPVFIITNVFDTIYMSRVCEYKLHHDTQEFFRKWGTYMEKNAKRFQKRYPSWGLFMPSCYAHGLYKIARWFTQLLVGEEQISMAQALANWMNESGPHVVLDKCEGILGPCNQYCPSVPLPPGLIET